ncbi:hypothetical protein [Nisaea sp.]|uniref:hypothetical protein n=1 Tax=Nisaea sp. TaxID=2024842 RepID=UPI0032EEB03B
MTADHLDEVMRYKLLEYSTCTDLGAKGFEQLNRLAIASLIFNGTLAAALGFATDKIVSRTETAVAINTDTVFAIGLLALLIIAVVFNLGAMMSNIFFWRMLKAIAERHRAVDQEIVTLLATHGTSRHAADPKPEAEAAGGRPARLSDAVYESVFGYPNHILIKVLTKSVFQTRNLTIAFYSLIIGGWLSYVSAILYGLKSPLAQWAVKLIPIGRLFDLPAPM